MTENVEYIEDHQLARLRAKARHQVCLVHEVHNVNFQQVTIKELVESASLFNLPIDVFCMTYVRVKIIEALNTNKNDKHQ